MGLNYKGVYCVFRWIDPGTFMMGSPEAERGRSSDERQHQVTIVQGFWIAETSVTQALWELVMCENPSQFKGKNRPVDGVNWNDCQVFIQELNTFQPDLEVRLPWEAEWEYACRAGTQTPFNFGKALSLDKVNYRGVWSAKVGGSKEKRFRKLSSQWSEDAKQETADVKSYPCNSWGLYEMHGNVWQWCQDRLQDNVVEESLTGSQNVRTERVVRGGSWNDNGRDVRSACRAYLMQDFRNFNLGCRLSLTNPRTREGSGSTNTM